MSDYRYVVFPRGKQPTQKEVAELRNLADVLAGKFAIGVSRDSGGVAIAFDAAAYDYGMLTHRSFAGLILKWEIRGGQVVDRLAFVKDAAALRPMQAQVCGSTTSDSTVRDTNRGQSVQSKKIAAEEAVARSKLGVQQTLRRQAALGRFAAFLPYLMIGLGGIAIISLGFYIRSSLLENSAEKRRETILRVADDPMSQTLEREEVPTE